MQCVYCAVWTESLNIIQVNASNLLKDSGFGQMGYVEARLVEALRYKPGSIPDGVTGIFY